MKFEDATLAVDRFGINWAYLISYRTQYESVRDSRGRHRQVRKDGTDYPFFVLPIMGNCEDGPYVGCYPSYSRDDQIPYAWRDFLDAKGEFDAPAPKITTRKNGETFYDWPRSPKGKRRSFQRPEWAPRFWDQEYDWGVAIKHNGVWSFSRTMKDFRQAAKQAGYSPLW